MIHLLIVQTVYSIVYNIDYSLRPGVGTRSGPCPGKFLSFKPSRGFLLSLEQFRNSASHKFVSRISNLRIFSPRHGSKIFLILSPEFSSFLCRSPSKISVTAIAGPCPECRPLPGPCLRLTAFRLWPFLIWWYQQKDGSSKCWRFWSRY